MTWNWFFLAASLMAIASPLSRQNLHLPATRIRPGHETAGSKPHPFWKTKNFIPNGFG